MYNRCDFLPVSREDMLERGWYYYDFLIITGDAYVDHPSFGAAVIGRVLEAGGYRVAILPQPSCKDTTDITAMGKPRYATLVTSGNLDSMVAHYTAAKKKRSEDYYSPGKHKNRRPDRAVTVYSKLAREAFPGLPVVIGGLEASLRRFAHYDYWDNTVRRPILFETGADYIVYGMGEQATIELASVLSGKNRRNTNHETAHEVVHGGVNSAAHAAAGKLAHSAAKIRGLGYIADEDTEFPAEALVCPSFEDVSASKKAYAAAAMLQYEEHDPVRGRAIIQYCEGKALVINPPAKTLTTAELDKVYDLPYTREPHPMYTRQGGVPAIDEVRFSIIHNRGCFGACNFCALAFHQGRTVASRSHESILKEAVKITKHPDFKGYIHDVGGPTANFRQPSCQKQLKNGMCRGKRCLAPEPCENLIADHSDYLKLLRKIAALPGVKKVFIRSGIRFDYLMLDKNGEFFTELVKNHISGQLKVAPEHCSDNVLRYMGKPKNEVYVKFSEKYDKLNEKHNKDQYLVPYLISSHPGCTTDDAITLAEYLNKNGRQPEQVQDFYPTPGTLSTCMYYTGLDPTTMKPVFVPDTPGEKAKQRALLQWKKPENKSIVYRALIETGRKDLIGYGKQCLVTPYKRKPKNTAANTTTNTETNTTITSQKNGK